MLRYVVFFLPLSKDEPYVVLQNTILCYIVLEHIILHYTVDYVTLYYVEIY